MNPTGQARYRAARVAGPACADELIRSGAMVIDVREPSEWLAGHIGGARHIPLGHLAAESHELPRDRTLIIVCRSGRRSARAAAQLVSESFKVVNLLGGLQAWHACGLPLDSQDDRPGRVA